jgi:hypothetical protein
MSDLLGPDPDTYFRVLRELGTETIVHVCCRESNLNRFRFQFESKRRDLRPDLYALFSRAEGAWDRDDSACVLPRSQPTRPHVGPHPWPLTPGPSPLKKPISDLNSDDDRMQK